MTPRIPAPSTAQAVWNEILTSPPAKFSANAGLVFERYLEFDFTPGPHEDILPKKRNLDHVLRMYACADPVLLSAWNRRWKQTALAARAEVFSATTDWRFLPGFGRKVALEVGFSFHRYGFPYLPGSAVKGIARTAAVAVLAEALGASSLQDLDDALNACDDESNRMMADLQEAYGTEPLKCNVDTEHWVRAFHAIFGSQASAGRAIFFSAIPVELEKEVPAIQKDILTPHFAKYYSEKARFPTNGEDPNPVAFITVAPGVKFLFAVGWRGTMDEARRDQARQWLELGLEKIGAGAKTGVGYGYFRGFDGVTVEPERSQNENRRDNPPPPPPDVETRFAIVTKNQNNPGMIAARDEQTGRIWLIPARLFGGYSPATKSRLRLEVRGNEVLKAEKL